MKKFLIGLGLAAVVTAAWANCTTHTYFMNGRMVTCTTCCYGNSCSTNCY